MRTTYCRGQDCRWPVTNNFPTLAAVELRVLVDSKSGAPSLVSVGAAVGDPQRLSALIFIVPLLATVEALHVGLLLLVRRRLCLAFAFTLALASFAARLAARLAALFGRLACFSLATSLLLRYLVCSRVVRRLATSALATLLAAFPTPLLPLPTLAIRI